MLDHVSTWLELTAAVYYKKQDRYIGVTCWFDSLPNYIYCKESYSCSCVNSYSYETNTSSKCNLVDISWLILRLTWKRLNWKHELWLEADLKCIAERLEWAPKVSAISRRLVWCKHESYWEKLVLNVVKAENNQREAVFDNYLSAIDVVNSSITKFLKIFNHLATSEAYRGANLQS